MAPPKYLVSSNGVALTLADVVALKKGEELKLLPILRPAQSDPNLPLCPQGIIEPGQLYPSAPDPARKLYLPVYEVAKDGAQDAVHLSVGLPHQSGVAVLRVDVTAKTPAAPPGTTIQAVPHVLEASLEYWLTDAQGRATTRETQKFPEVSALADPSDPSRKRVELLVDTTGMLGRLAQALQTQAAQATLVLTARVNVGIQGGDQGDLPDDQWTDTTGVPPAVFEPPPATPPPPVATPTGLVGLVAGKNSDSRVELFGIRSDHEPFNSWQTSPGGAYSGWSSLGGLVKALAVARNADGRLELFAIGMDDGLYRNAQAAPSSGPWSGWQALGGKVKQIAVGQNSDGRLEVFGIGMDDALWNNWQTSPGGAYSGWASLGGGVKKIAVAKNQDGRLEVFAIGMDDGLWHNWQSKPSAGPWSGWNSLGGGVKDIAPLLNAAGAIDVFAIGMDNALWHNWQKAPNSGSWSGWVSLAGGVKALAPTVNTDGRTEVLAIGMDDALYGIWQGEHGTGGWSGWYSLGGKIKSLAGLNGHDGRLEAFGIGMDDAAWNTHQSRPSAGPWSDWQSMGVPPAPAVAPPATTPPATPPAETPPVRPHPFPVRPRIDPIRVSRLRRGDLEAPAAPEAPEAPPAPEAPSAPEAPLVRPLALLRPEIARVDLAKLQPQRIKSLEYIERPPAAVSAVTAVTAVGRPTLPKKIAPILIKPVLRPPGGRTPIRTAVATERISLYRSPNVYPYVYDLGGNRPLPGQALTPLPDDTLDPLGSLRLWWDEAVQLQFYYVPRQFVLSRVPGGIHKPSLEVAFHGDGDGTAATTVELQVSLTPQIDAVDLVRLRERAAAWLAQRGIRPAEPQLLVREPKLTQNGFVWLLPTETGEDERVTSDGLVSFRDGINDSLLMPYDRFRRVLACLLSPSPDGIRGQVSFESPEDPAHPISLQAKVSLRQITGTCFDAELLDATANSAHLRFTSLIESDLRVSRRAAVRAGTEDVLLDLSDAAGGRLSDPWLLPAGQSVEVRLSSPWKSLAGLRGEHVRPTFTADPRPDQLQVLLSAFIGEENLTEARSEIDVETLPDYFAPAPWGSPVTSLTVELRGGTSVSFDASGPMRKKGSFSRSVIGNLIADPTANAVSYRVITVRADGSRATSAWVDWDGGSPLLVQPLAEGGSP